MYHLTPFIYLKLLLTACLLPCPLGVHAIDKVRRDELEQAKQSAAYGAWSVRHFN